MAGRKSGPGSRKMGGIPRIKQILIRLALTWSNESDEPICMAQFVQRRVCLGQLGVQGWAAIAQESL
jgi:hypothetical protein